MNCSSCGSINIQCWDITDMDVTHCRCYDCGEEWIE